MAKYDRDIQIRPARMSDVEDLYRVRLAPAAARETLALPSLSFEAFEKGLSSAVESAREHQLVAAQEGRVVGMASLSERSGRRAHTGSVGIMVHDDYLGRGVGTALLRGIVDLADNWLRLSRLQLEVYADNAAALRLYEKFGFEREGRMRRGAVRDGELADLVTMGRLRD